jgi:FAD/FMN-containing dehydrogenase
VTSILAFSSTVAAVDAASLLRRSVPELQSLELFLQPGLDLVCRLTGVAGPFLGEHRAYLLAEAAAQTDPMPALAAVIDSVAGVEDVAVATDTERRAQLWHYREGHTEAINRLGAPHKLDVTLPAAALVAFIDHVAEAVRDADPTATTWLFGHVGDGNVHVNVTGVEQDDMSVDDRVMHYAAELGGSISSEHGIGTAKRNWLHLNRSDAELAAFRRLKTALDPAGILNPNVLLPAGP